jgi:3-deoxy-D-manno-octulosonic-acid transferase
VSFALRSENPVDHREVFCIDTYGETGTFFRLADLCFVGGSLVPVGGHNIYEPVALGKPVLHGPFMHNAQTVKNYLRQEQVAFEVKNAEEICEVCVELLTDTTKLKKISRRSLKISRNESLNQIDRIVQLSKIFN